MAIITFSKATAFATMPFPTAPLRDLLIGHLSGYKWQCGEHDRGGKTEMGRFHGHMLVSGRSFDTIVFTELRAVDAVLPGGAPPHLWHVNVGAPTTEIDHVADRITLIICMTLMIADEEDSRCQLYPGGHWLTAQELLLVFKRVLGGEPLSLATGSVKPSAVTQPSAPIAAAPLAIPSPSEIRQRMLAPITLMLERPLRPDWPTIERFARELDPDGDWRHHVVPGMDLLLGRDTRVVVHTKDAPFPDFVYEDSFDRSFWFKGDRSRVAAHRCHTAIGCALDTVKADWVTIRQTAKVVSLVTGMLARLPGTVAVHNLDTDAIFEPAMAGGFLKFLGHDQLPVMLWTWTKWHSLTDGNVCMSTSGLMPFLGHEIEVWNAPLTCEEVREKTSDLITYLLDKGPTIGHGDSAGRTSDDQSIRCFLGPSRAARSVPVQALFLEFGEKGEIQPRPDLPEAAVPAARAAFPADPGEQAARVIDDALQSIIANSASPAMRKLLTDVVASREAEAGQSRSASASGDGPAPPATPTRRPGGFGRKGL